MCPSITLFFTQIPRIYWSSAPPRLYNITIHPRNASTIFAFSSNSSSRSAIYIPHLIIRNYRSETCECIIFFRNHYAGSVGVPQPCFFLKNSTIQPRITLSHISTPLAISLLNHIHLIGPDSPSVPSIYYTLTVHHVPGVEEEVGHEHPVHHHTAQQHH